MEHCCVIDDCVALFYLFVFHLCVAVHMEKNVRRPTLDDLDFGE